MTIPVTVLTGFLGSGKTTVLNHLVRQPAMADTVVIINEFGEIALDHLLIERTNENIALLRSGCICCAVRGDLVQTLNDLIAQQDRGTLSFSRVIVETTGLADPAPILHTLMVEPETIAHYCPQGVITTVDSVNGLNTLAAHGEAVKQVAMADRILLTKGDLTTEAALRELHARLRRANRGAPILRIKDGWADPADILSTGPYDPASKGDDVCHWLEEEFDGKGKHDHDHRSHRHDDDVATYCVTLDAPVRWQAFCSWLELVAAMRGEQLLRLKGIVAIDEHRDRPVVIHGVQHIIHPVATLSTWPSDDRRTRIVFITRDLPSETIERTLVKFAQVRSDEIKIS